MIVISLKHRSDGNWYFAAKSKGNNVPLVVSANSYSSLNDCFSAAKGFANEQEAAVFEVEEEKE
jgi:hypothetical protein